MLTSQELLTELQQAQLNDPEGTTWSQGQLIGFLNQALRTLAFTRPEATAVVAVVNVQPGARQQIPDNGTQLLRVGCNVLPDGKIGPSVRLVRKDDLDSFSSSWRSAVGPHVREYMFDSRAPTQFFIYPNAPSDCKLEIEYSAHAPTVTAAKLSEPLPVDPIYAQAIKELILYESLSGDATNGQSGAQHLQMAMELLGVKDTQDARLSPSRKSE